MMHTTSTCLVAILSATFVMACDDAGLGGDPPGDVQPDGGAGTDGAVAPDASAPGVDTPLGWAGVPGHGVSGTTGGAGGQTVTATTAAELASYATSSSPLNIEIAGPISIGELRIKSNKTIVGTTADAAIRGGIRMTGSATTRVSNVILKNLTIDATTATTSDAVELRYADHIWIDHCDISDASDGLLDIVHTSDYVTVSWTKFSYSTDQPHRFAMLIGNDDAFTADRGHLHVTIHHNWWATRVVERMPRVRFGEVHVFNNYVASTGNNYAVGAGIEAKVRIEHNYFDDVDDPHAFIGDPQTTGASMIAIDNVYMGVSATAKRSTSGNAFTPPYQVAFDAAADVKAAVMQGAGPQ